MLYGRCLIYNNLFILSVDLHNDRTVIENHKSAFKNKYTHTLNRQLNTY